MLEMKFSFTDGSLQQLDQIRERCGYETYAEVLGAALALYDHLSRQAADGCIAAEITFTESGCGQVASISIKSLSRVYARAREQERELLPPEPQKPAARTVTYDIDREVARSQVERRRERERAERRARLPRWLRWLA